MNVSTHRAITYSVDAFAGASIVGALMGWMPAIAALAAVLWYVVQIYESKTVQRHVRRLRLKALRRRLAKLEKADEARP